MSQNNHRPSSVVMNDTIYQNATGPVSIRLTNDYLFKALLQKNEHVLKSLICSLLHFSPDQLRNAQVTNPIILGDHITNKTVVLDVNVSFQNGSRLNLEMQVANEYNWTERSICYICRNFTDLNQGDDYDSIKPVFQIGFLDFTLFPKHPSFYATYKLTDIKTHHIFTDRLSIGVIDLTNIALATPEDKRYNIDKWAKLFKAQTWEDIKMLAAQDNYISEAASTIYQLSEDERIRQECEAREDFLKRQKGMQKRIARMGKEIDDLAENNSLLTAQNDHLTAELSKSNAELAQRNKEIAELNALLAAHGIKTDK